MSIVFLCAACGKKLKAQTADAGRRTKCSGCQAVLSIPLPAESNPPAPASPAVPAGEDSRRESRGEESQSTAPTPSPRPLGSPVASAPSRGLSNVRKVLGFGVLGALGCLAGWLIGEPFLLLALPASKEARASLASKPDLPQLAKSSAPAAPLPPPILEVLAATRTLSPEPPPPVLPVVVARIPQAPEPPPPEFAQRLEKAGGKSGDVQITLIWSNVNDLDLHCIEPGGEEIFYAHRKSRTGGELDVDMNAGGALTKRPVENIYWPKGKAAEGTYKIYVNHYANHGGQDPTEYKVSILVSGVRKEFSGKISRNQPKRLIHELEVKAGAFAMENDAELRVAASSEVILHQDGKNYLKVRIVRGKTVGAVACQIDGDLQGITAPAFSIAADQNEAILEMSASAATALGRRMLVVRASAGMATSAAAFQLIVRAAPPSLLIAVSPELVIHQAGSNQLRIRLARANLAGAVRVRLEGDLRGIAPSEFTVNAADNESIVEINGDALAPAGLRALKVVASAGEVQTDTTFRLLIKEVPPALRLALPPEIQIIRGGQNQLPVRIARERFKGAVQLKLEGDMAGLAPVEHTLAADRDEDEIPLMATAAAVGTREIRLVALGGGVRAEGSVMVVVAADASSAAPPWSWQLVLVIGLWTALLALGLSLALVMGQNRYLARRLISWRALAILAAGSLLAGMVAGGVGQALYGLLTQIRLVPELGFLAGWLLLGSLLGRGVVFFIPNLSAWRTTAAGACGGLLGAAAFLAVSNVGNLPGRFMGAAILGFALGLMVALVETAFRKVWLEVSDGPQPVRAVNLGATPIVIGGDASRCTIMVPGAAAKALRFWEKDGQIYCLDILAEKTYPVSPGYRHPLKNAEVVVCSNDRGPKSSSSPPLKSSAPAMASVSPSPAFKEEPKAPPMIVAVAIPQPQAQQGSPLLVTAPCPLCGNRAKGVPGKRVCATCYTMF